MRENKGAALLKISVTAVLAACIGAGTMYLLMRHTESKYAVYLEAAEKIENRFIGEYDSAAAIEGSVEGLIESLGDRWSRYYNAEEAAAYKDYAANEFVGVGVTVTKQDGEGLVICEVKSGSGAEKAGLVAGDTIVSADGESLLSCSLSEATDLVGGEENTTVLLGICHADGSEEEIEVKRKRIYESPVSGELIGGVGYVKLENFETGAAKDFIAMTDSLLEQGAQSLVFDVRNNGGGYVAELTKILDYLLPEGDIFVFVSADGTENRKTSDASCVEVPMAVLVNARSYSAAEYFAAMLQQCGYPVIGEQTVGKGYSQQTFYLSDGSALVLSTSKYCLPDGTSLAETGVTPDVEEAMTEEEDAKLYYGVLAQEDDPQLQAALKAVN